jgi:glycosyltransferase involved in cell wall biosynthesis
MTAESSLALVLPCRNYGGFIEEMLRSIGAQTVPPAEVVVIDDGSEDDTASTAERVAVELCIQFSVRVVRQPALGLAAAVDRGVRETRSPLIGVVSADDVLMPGYVERLTAALGARPDAGFAYPRMQMFGDEDGLVATYPFNVDRLLFDHNYVPGVSVVRRAAFLSAGGLSELPAHEDWDFFLTLAELGWSGVLVPEVLYRWRRHTVARNHSSMVRRLSLRVRILWRHRRLLVRRAHMALPWTIYGALRRAKAAIAPRHSATRRSQSAWVEGP